MDDGSSGAPARRGLAGRISGRPRTWFWAALVIGLLVGVGIGASGGVDEAAYDRAVSDNGRLNARVADLRRDLAASGKQVDAQSDAVKAAEGRSATAEAELKKATARGEVPDFVGMDADAAESAEAVTTYDWNVKTVRVVSATAPGTVVAQSVEEGKTLKAGRSITLTVAKKAPPKPKEWVTTRTLTGDSSTKTDEFTIPSTGKARLSYSMPQDGNNAITLYKAPSEYVDLLLNEIGPQEGTTRIYDQGTYYLDISGAYTIQVQVFKRPK